MRLVLVVFSAQLLGDAEFGKFTFAMAFTSLFMILADGGVHQLIVREIARAPERTRELVANGLCIKTLLALGTAGLIYLCGTLTGKADHVLLAVFILGGQMIVGSFSDFFSCVLRGHQRMNYDVAASLIFGVIVTGGGIAVLAMGYDFVMLAYMYLLANGVRLAYTFLIVRLKFCKVGLAFDWPLIKSLLKQGFPFGVLYFFALMYTYIDSTMLSLMVGDKEVGWYNAAYRLVFAMMFIPVASMKAVFPALALYYRESNDQFKMLFERSFKVMFVVGFSGATLLTLFAEPVVDLLFGAEYAPAAGALKILVWAAAIIFIGTVQTHTTRASDRQGFTAKVVAGSAVLNLALNFILIPKYTLYGAAWATLLTEFFVFAVHGVYLRKNLVSPPVLKLAPKIIIINLAVFLFAGAASDYDWFFVVPGAVLICLAMLFLTKYFSPDEWRFLKGMLKPQV